MLCTAGALYEKVISLLVILNVSNCECLILPVPLLLVKLTFTQLKFRCVQNFIYLFIYFSCAHLLLCLQVILKDVEDYEAQVMALETLVSSSQTNRIQFEKLCDEWKHLHIAVKVRGHSYKKCE